MLPEPLLPRRHFLRGAGGLGALALAWLTARETRAADAPPGTHFAPKAKRVVQIFCCGGVSHVDTFDYKPELARRAGQQLTDKGKIDTFFGQPGTLMPSPFKFKQHGASGAWVSDLLPHLAGRADDLTFFHAMTAKSSNHTPATFQANSGFTMNGFPCLGAWLSYGLGTVNEDLPAYVVLSDPRGLPAGGSVNWTSGFLPATHQGVALRAGPEPVTDLNTPADTPAAARVAGTSALERLNRLHAAADPGDGLLAARVRSYELAARMQLSVPDALDVSREPLPVQGMYGLDEPASAGFGRNCLMARRLLERGVRFVQLIHGGAFGSPRINWDGHEDLADNHRTQAASFDKPAAALLRDLKQRGMLDDTLVLWQSEFGRTPFTQGVGAKGRDHHPTVYTTWMAGAGLKAGHHHGASDEVGYGPAEDKTSIYDYHATVLHLLGLDHERLTYYHNGTRRRLTDVHGSVIDAVLA